MVLAVVLLGNELGIGMGHAKRLLPFARALAERGHRPVLVLPDLVAAAPALRDSGFPVLPAPVWNGRHFPNKPTRSFADILADKGFSDPATLTPLVLGWQRIMELLRPGLVVIDHSPTLALAAFGTVPFIVVGNGFTVPPGGGPVFPDFVSDTPPAFPEERLLETVAALQRRRRRPVPSALPELFPPDDSFPLVYPEIDPYRTVRQRSAIGPLAASPPPTAGLDDGAGDSGRVFAYLSAGHPGVGALLAGLAESGLQVEAYVRDAPPPLTAKLERGGIRLHRTPPPLAEALSRNDAFLHHGGSGSVMTALAVGRPQVCLPRYLEQRLVCEALKSQGVAVYFYGKFDPAAVVAAVAGAIGNGRPRERALDLAARLHGRGHVDNLSRIAERCDELVGG